jgi:hypothetical protein
VPNLPNPIELEIAAAAAALIVEEGLEYGPAKKKAIKQMGLNSRTSLPSSELVHEQVMSYVQLYCADTQPAELAALRQLALKWMQRLHGLQDGCRVYIEGAVWLGSATRLSDIRLQVFSLEPKGFEIAMLNEGLDFGVAPVSDKETSSHLYLHANCAQLNETIGIHIHLHDFDAERGIRKPDSQGLAQAGDARALHERILIAAQAPTPGRG